MKPATWKMALIFGLALSMNALTERDQNTANAVSPVQRGQSGGRGGGEGNGRSQAGGGSGRPQGGGGGGVGGGGRAQGGGAQAGGGARIGGGFRGVGGIHAPSTSRPRNLGGAQIQGGGAVRNNSDRDRAGVSSNRTGHIASPNRSPSLSHPNPGSIRSGITRNPILNRGGTSNNQRRDPRVDVRNQNQLNAGNTRIDGRNNLRIGGSSIVNSTRSGIANRAYNGNFLRLNNRQLSLADNLYRPAYHRHSNYYHGSWNDNRRSGFGSGFTNGSGSRLGYGIGSNRGYGWGLGNQYGNGGYGYAGRQARYGRYGYRPLGWGLGGWGLGSLVYNSGYLGYSNPYFASGGWSGYNYSQPVLVSYTTPVTVIENSTSTSSDSVLDNAVAAFRRNDYDAALDITNKGITQTPDDAVLHEFRALVLFAKEDYQQAATTIHSVLAVGPGWDWTTMSGIYANVDLYTMQLRALEAFTKSNPQDATSHFLLAYHYLSCGHTEAAVRQLQEVVRLMPSDRVAADILQMLQPPPADDATASGNPLQPTAETEVLPGGPLDPKTLVGNWKATRQDGSAFTLNMTDDSKFTWGFALKDQPAQEFGGSYSVEDNVLALERKDGGSLIAEITPEGDGKFNFRMLGAPEEDRGLDFSR